GLTGDAIGFVRGADGEIRWQKPSFGGGIIAAIRSRTQPSLATVRAGSFEPGRAPDAAVLDAETVPLTLPSSSVRRLEVGREEDSRWKPLDGARLVITVGMGIGGPDRLGALDPLLAATDGSLAATRRVVDAGWVPRQLQVGLTGRSLDPDLAVLLGVSGAVNHLVGWKRARALLAVNVDPKAPVFRGVDVGIVGRWEEILDPLTRELSAWVHRPPAPPA
ncbi:MAG TPA: FAD-binding protein, partial [Thermoplasmata archaeon]|nr:FAD-binding protein [Thermoplasmata archaeon]